MKLTNSQKQNLDEANRELNNFLRLLLGDVELVNGENFESKKYKIGSKLICEVWCRGYYRRFEIGARGSFKVFNK